MKDLASELRAAVQEARARLEVIGEKTSLETGPGTWSKRQILGHLIDSALNNDQRFVRAQSGEALTSPITSRMPGWRRTATLSDPGRSSFRSGRHSTSRSPTPSSGFRRIGSRRRAESVAASPTPSSTLPATTRSTCSTTCNKSSTRRLPPASSTLPLPLACNRDSIPLRPSMPPAWLCRSSVKYSRYSPSSAPCHPGAQAVSLASISLLRATR